MKLSVLITACIVATSVDLTLSWSNFVSYDPLVACDQVYKPLYCDHPERNLSALYTIDDFFRCAPGMLEIEVRNFFWAGAGRKITYRCNYHDFKRFIILQRDLRDVRGGDTSVTVLGRKISTPVGIANSPAQILADSNGELATARAACKFNTVMILSSFSTYSLEDVFKAAKSVKPVPVLWMHTYLFKDRKETMELIRKAESAGYSGIVVNIDTPFTANLSCGANSVLHNVKFPNFRNGTMPPLSDAANFGDLAWLVRNTALKVVAKGVLTAKDALNAAKAGVHAVIVSNEDGRQMDDAPSTIETLPEVVKALNHTDVEVYMEGGIRDGRDVFIALARGARAVFIRTSVVWGLTAGGERGVSKVLNILNGEFNETMILAGFSSPREIPSDSVIPDYPKYHFIE